MPRDFISYLAFIVFIKETSTILKCTCFYKQSLHLQTQHIRTYFITFHYSYCQVTFLRSFIADIFCSMPRIFTDLQYTICIYATGTFLIEEPDDLGINFVIFYSLSLLLTVLTLCSTPFLLFSFPLFSSYIRLSVLFPFLFFSLPLLSSQLLFPCT